MLRWSGNAVQVSAIPVEAVVTLSPRQLEIVTLIGRDGDQWQTVAAKLGISPNTVRSHVDKILLRNPSTKSPRDAISELYWRMVGTGDT